MGTTFSRLKHNNKGKQNKEPQFTKSQNHSDSISTSGLNKYFTESKSNNINFCEYKTCLDYNMPVIVKIHSSIADSGQNQCNHSNSSSSNSPSSLSSSTYFNSKSSYQSPKSPADDHFQADGKLRPCHSTWDTCISPVVMMKLMHISTKMIPPILRYTAIQNKLQSVNRIKTKFKLKVSEKSTSVSDSLSEGMTKFRSTKTTSFSVHKFAGVFKDTCQQSLNTDNDRQFNTKLEFNSLGLMKDRTKSMQSIKMPQIFKPQNMNRKNQ